MNPLNKLRDLVARGATTIEAGVVVAVSEGSVKVRTATGVRSVAPAGATTYKVGDSVRVQNNVLLGKGSDPDTLPVFRV